jgi:two-component system sensor histidine kinase HydH
MMLEPEGRKAGLPRVVPLWVIAILFLGVVALSAMMAKRDINRERDYLQELFLQKGEILIRAIETGARMGWLDLGSEEGLALFLANLEGSELLSIAVTDASGGLYAASAPAEELGGGFQGPDPVGSFAFPGKPRWRVTPGAGTGKVFWVYRPLWFTLERKGPPYAPPGGTHHQRRPPGPFKGPPPMDGGHPSPKAYPPNLYAWLGFDMAPFEAAESSARHNSLLFVGLTGLASLAALLALFWAQSSRLNKRLYENSSQMADSVFSRLPVGLLISDLSGTVAFANQAMERISGLRAEGFLGKRLSSLAVGSFPKDGEFSGVESSLSFRGGKSAQVALTGAPVVGRGGAPVGRVLLMADLDELGRLRAELAQKERLATLGSMSRGLAHELRNPLGAIKGLALHLQRLGSLGPPDREALDVILESVARLDSTITDFLDFAKPTSLRKARVPLGNLLSKLRSLVAHDPQARTVADELRLPEAELLAQADEAKLSQAFLNLYLNAIQACSSNPPGRPGSIVVSLDRHGPGLASIGFSDNGPGFQEDQLLNPFVPYFTSKASGTGLGLPLAKKIVEAHDGRLLIGNREGGGAVVTVLPPRAKGDGTGKGGPGAGGGGPEEGPKPPEAPRMGKA